MNSFTSANPDFHYHSAEASNQLGLPDAPEIHLAITELAQEMLELAALSSMELRIQRIVALRQSSRTVLFGYSKPMLELYIRVHLDLPISEELQIAAQTAPAVNWLAKAVNRLREEGHDVRADFNLQRSGYGWRRLA